MMLNVTKIYLSHDIESIVQRPGHPPSRHRTNLQLHIPKWKEVGLGSTSHRVYKEKYQPGYGPGRGQMS